jgi:hypothetical protein
MANREESLWMVAIFLSRGTSTPGASEYRDQNLVGRKSTSGPFIQCTIYYAVDWLCDLSVSPMLNVQNKVPLIRAEVKNYKAVLLNEDFEYRH